MDHAGRVLSSRQERLTRVVRAFESKGRMLDARLTALHREIREIDVAIGEIELSMGSALVHVLSLHVPAVRRIAGLRQRSGDLAAQLALLRTEAISAKAKTRLAEDLAETLASEALRKKSELESLEATAVFTVSSLRQVVNG